MKNGVVILLKFQKTAIPSCNESMESDICYAVFLQQFLMYLIV